MHLQSKLTSEMCQNIGSLDGKTEQNHLKMPTLPPFIQKNHCIYWKTKNVNRFSIVKKIWCGTHTTFSYLTLK